MELHDLGEFGLIERLSARLAQRPGVRAGIGDDAALLEPLAAALVTCDGLIEQVHFRRDWTTPRLLGRKAVTVNVSDIAAMGGRPVAAFVTLALGPQDDLVFVDELYAGLEEAATQYGLTIAGGDTVRSPHELMLSLTVVGTLGDTARPVLRSGARPGDVLLVTGTLGDAAAGLALLQNPASGLPAETRDDLLRRHHDPTARLAEMQAALAANGTPHGVTAALDLSDGLAGDAAHIAARSNVALEIETARLPLSPACRAAAGALGLNALDWALYGGEDYELLLCVASESAEAVAQNVTRATGTPVTRVGCCLACAPEPGRPAVTPSVTLVSATGQRTPARGAFTHF